MDNQIYPSQPSGGIASVILKRRGLILGLILLIALFGFEMFNFSTTQYALADLLGDMRFAGVRWATILAIAFCGIDFAGIARLFSNGEEESSGREAWFLFIAWLLAATLNATLTWWGVSMALVNHTVASTSVVEPGLLMKIVPIFVSIVVWVTRILVISAISSEGSRLLRQEPQLASPQKVYQKPYQPQHRPSSQSYQAQNNISKQAAVPSPPPPPIPVRPAPRPAPRIPSPIPDLEEEINEPEYIPDPSYSPVQPAYHSLNVKSPDNSNQKPRR